MVLSSTAKYHRNLWTANMHWRLFRAWKDYRATHAHNMQARGHNVMFVIIHQWTNTIYPTTYSQDIHRHTHCNLPLLCCHAESCLHIHFLFVHVCTLTGNLHSWLVEWSAISFTGTYAHHSRFIYTNPIPPFQTPWIQIPPPSPTDKKKSNKLMKTKRWTKFTNTSNSTDEVNKNKHKKVDDLFPKFWRQKNF